MSAVGIRRLSGATRRSASAIGLLCVQRQQFEEKRVGDSHLYDSKSMVLSSLTWSPRPHDPRCSREGRRNIHGRKLATMGA